MIAIIPAAGRGTHMGHLTKNLPKPLLPLWGKPILEHILEQIRTSVKEIIIIVGYQSEKIIKYFQTGSRLGLHINYVIQQNLLGNAHALYCARHLVKPYEKFILQWSDILVPSFWYKRLLAEYKKLWQGVLTIDQGDYYSGAGVLLGPEGEVLKIIEKPAPGEIKTCWNSSGIFLFSQKIISFLPNHFPKKREVSISEVVARFIKSGNRIKAIPISKKNYYDIKDQSAYEYYKNYPKPKFLF